MIIFSRRNFLVAGSALAGSALAGALRAMPSNPACVLTTEQEEGPYYVDDEKLRQNITEGKPGVPLRLRVALVNSKTCAPLLNASLDIWHCDAGGIYSGYTDNKGGPGGPGGFGGPGGPGGWPPGPPPDDDHGFGPPPNGPMGGGGHHPQDASRFLRGVQRTDNSGLAEFTTIYPGWYQGRAIHIHVKVHTGGHVSHTGQLFFPEDITSTVSKMQPYVNHRDVHLTTQAEDGVFGPQHGADGLLTLARLEKADSAGFLATVTLAVNPEATPPPTGMRGRPGPRRTDL